jgi:hypothetical protein
MRHWRLTKNSKEAKTLRGSGSSGCALPLIDATQYNFEIKQEDADSTVKAIYAQT